MAKLRTAGIRDGQTYELDDIPRDLWEQFCKRCEELLPEHADDGQAWAAMFANVIASVLDSSEQVFLMTGIPSDMWGKLCGRLARVGHRPDTLLARLIASANDGQLYGGTLRKIKSKRKGRGVMLVTDVPIEALEQFRAGELDASETLLQILIAAGAGNLSIVPGKPPTKPTAKSTAKGAR